MTPIWRDSLTFVFCRNRCLYNALNDRIRNLLLQYDYSKSTDPLQPYAAHIASLLTRDHPQTSDIVVTAADESFRLHKFILSARSPYFARKLSVAADIKSSELPSTIPPQAFSAGIRYLYLGEAPRELRSGPGTGFTESEVFAGIDKIAKQVELHGLVETIVDSGDRRLARQRRTEEVRKGRDQIDKWFQGHVIRKKVVVDIDKANEVKWHENNDSFADVLLRADEVIEDSDLQASEQSELPEEPHRARKCTIFPAHKAMLIRSEFFLAMFSSGFKEAQVTDQLHVVQVDCSPQVLELVLTYLYTEKSDVPLSLAVDVLFAADLLLIERLKSKAAVVISTLGSGSMGNTDKGKLRSKKASQPASSDARIQQAESEETDIDIYEIIRAAWLTRVQRLEEFAARYFAYRLESYVDSQDFEDLILESSARIQKRQETDSIELLDDIRYYLSERFRMRFEESGINQIMEEKEEKIENGVLDNNDANTDAQVSDRYPASDITRGESESHSTTANKTPEDEGIDLSNDENKIHSKDTSDQEAHGPVIRSLDGEIAGDEFGRDAANYQILMNKLDALLEKLDLDA